MTYKNNKQNCRLPVLFFFCFISLIEGSAKLYLNLIEFDNTRGFDYHGDHCDSTWFGKSSQCDHKITVCVDTISSDNTISSCKYFRHDLDTKYNEDKVTFSIDPYPISFLSWPGKVRIKVETVDHDSATGNDYVGFLSGTIEGSPTKTWVSHTIYGHQKKHRNTLVLKFSTKIECDSHFYGDTCIKYCKPSNDKVGGHYTCTVDGSRICLPGWTGSYCKEGIDDCASSPCSNGSTCVDRFRSYSCLCATGFTGGKCEVNIDDCVNVTCDNGGVCYDLINGFKCMCPVGFYGNYCEYDHDYCANVTCENNGRCEDRLSDFVCHCPEGYSGRYCQTNVDECIEVVCENGGTCQDLVGSYECQCMPGYMGNLCQIDVDDCHLAQCLNGARCIDGIDSYSCDCLRYWNGSRCDIPLMEDSGRNNTLDVRGDVRGDTLLTVCKRLVRIISGQSSLDLSDLQIKCSSKLYMDNKRMFVTHIWFNVTLNMTQLSVDLVRNLLHNMGHSRLSDFLDFEIYYGALHALPNADINPRVNQSIEKKKEKEKASWLSTHWYVILIVVLIVPAAVLILSSIIKKKRQAPTLVTDEKSISFINELYLEQNDANSLKNIS